MQKNQLTKKMSILFVAPHGVDSNSDRARNVARACPNIEVRDIDLDRLHEMPTQLTGVPTLVTDEDVFKGTDCLAALADNIQTNTTRAPQVSQAPLLGSSKTTPGTDAPSGPLNEKTSSFNSGSGPVKAEDIQAVLNNYRQGMN